MPRYPGRWLVACGAAAWLVAVLLTLLYLASAVLISSTSCELAPGSSVFGRASSSLLPPGVVCTYEVEVGGGPLTVVTGPPLVRLLVVGVALGGLPVLVYLHRLLRRDVGRRLPVGRDA